MATKEFLEPAFVNANSITTPAIAPLNVTRSKLEAVGKQLSGSSTTFSTTSTSFTAVTNLSITITTVGRPVMVFLIPDPAGSAQGVSISATAAVDAISGTVQIKRASTSIAQFGFALTATYSTGLSALSQVFSAGAVFTIDEPSAGTYVYSVEGKVNNGDTSLGVQYVKLCAYEL